MHPHPASTPCIHTDHAASSHAAIVTAAHYGYQWVLPHDPAGLTPGPTDLVALKITLIWTICFWLSVVWPAIL